MAALLGLVNASCQGGNSGGGNAVWVAKQAQVTSFTLASGEQYYDTVTMEATEVFTKFEFEDDTFEYKESVSQENGSIIVETTVEFYTAKMGQASRDAIQELMDESNCGLISIVEDNNGNKWVVGYTEFHGKNRKMKLLSAESTTGKALTDLNGTTVIMSYSSREKARTFVGTVPV